MRIIGGHDYYDGCMSFGQDNSIVFVRDSHIIKTDTIPFKEIPPSFGLKVKGQTDVWKNTIYVRYQFTWKNVTYDIKPMNIIVASKIYFGIMLTYSSYISGVKELYFWDHNSFETYINAIGLEITSKPNKWYSNNDTLKSTFKPYDVYGKTLTYMIDNKIITGIYDINKEHWLINCDGLKKIEFYRLMDSYTIFQELSMWTSGVLPRDSKSTVDITDNDIKIHKHGFNKFSFRKQKVKK